MFDCTNDLKDQFEDALLLSAICANTTIINVVVVAAIDAAPFVNV